MKLQKVFSYKYGDKSHYKYLITLPEERVNQLGWEAGGELQESIDGERLVLTWVGKMEKSNAEVNDKKMTYEEFRDIIQKELKRNPDGLTWTELKIKLKLPQKVPNNKWVSRMEKDIGLLRVKNIKGIIWRLK